MTAGVPEPRKLSNSDENKGRRNKAYAAIKQELADKEKMKKKMAKMKGKSKNNPKDMVNFSLYLKFFLFLRISNSFIMKISKSKRLVPSVSPKYPPISATRIIILECE